MFKLKAHSGFHDLLEDGNLYLHLRKMSHTIYAGNGKVSHIHHRCLLHKTKLSVSPFIEVPLPNQESYRSYIPRNDQNPKYI
jgi:hypothetical protein